MPSKKPDLLNRVFASAMPAGFAGTAGRSLAASLLFGAALFASCSGDGETDSPDDEDNRSSGFSATVVASDEFLQLRVAVNECLERLGYADIDSPEGVLLLDGSRFRTESGSGFTVSGQVLYFLADREACGEEVGFLDFIRASGHETSGAEVSQEQIDEANAFHLARYNCVTERGWDVRPPVQYQGQVHFFPFSESDEEYDAFRADMDACANEIREEGE